MQLQERDEQIEKLIQRLTELHAFNTTFANENERLQQAHRECADQLANAESTLASQEMAHAEQIQRLRDDVKMMKTLVYRLNVQLERHQDLLRTHMQSAAADHPIAVTPIDFTDEAMQQQQQHGGQQRGGSSRVLDWGTVNSHTLGPLLQAYTEIISDKNDLVQQYETELGRFTGQLKDVMTENERLHAEMDEMRRTDETWTSDKTRLQSQLDLFR